MSRGPDCACWCSCSAGAAPGMVCQECRDGDHMHPPKEGKPK